MGRHVLVALEPRNGISLIRTSCDVVLAGADHGLSACIADHLVVLDCVIPGIKHHAARAVRAPDTGTGQPPPPPQQNAFLGRQAD